MSAGFPVTIHMIALEQTFANGSLQKFFLLLLPFQIESILSVICLSFLRWIFWRWKIQFRKKRTAVFSHPPIRPMPHPHLQTNPDYWLLELGELAGLRKTDVEVVKAFVSRTDDIYRPSYGRTVESHPRQCIIVGTTNSESGFLRDITGNRRFWPIKVTGVSKRKSWDMTDEEVVQLWAEAKYLYGQGETLYLNEQENSEALSEQIDAMETDERQGIVEEYLNTLLPDNWNSMDLYERRNFLTNSTSAKGTVQRKTVSNAEIWSECFCRNLSDLKPSDSYAIAALMTKVDGWERTEKIRKLAIYGRQRIYERL